MATADDMMVVNHSASVVDRMIVMVPAERVVDVLFFREHANIVCVEREGNVVSTTSVSFGGETTYSVRRRVTYGWMSHIESHVIVESK